MKRILLGVLFFFCLSLPAFAGEYAGLTPGKSTKQEVDRELGRPIKSYDDHRYDYSPEGHDLAGLSVQFTPQNIMSRIHLVFQEPYAVDQVREWFGLSDKATGVETVKGRLVELYEDQGIKIVFEGKNNTGKVVQLSHADFSEENGPIVSDTCPAAAEQYAKQADPFIEKDQYKKAIPHLEKAAMCDPKRVIYSSMLGFAYLKADQLNKAIDTAKKVVQRNEDYISYSVLGTAYFRKKEWKLAIPYLEEAIKFKQDRKLKDNLEFLGVSYYQEGRLKEALTAMVKSYKRKKSPLNTYYIALISDKLGEKEDARYYYKKYLALRHDNADMNSAAKERLSALNSQTKQKSKHSLSDVIGVFQKEMKDFNSD